MIAEKTYLNADPNTVAACITRYLKGARDRASGRDSRRKMTSDDASSRQDDPGPSCPVSHQEKYNFISKSYEIL